MTKMERLYKKQINQHLNGYKLIRLKEELPIIGWSAAASTAIGAIVGGVSLAITKDPAFSTGLGLGIAGTGTVWTIEGLALSYDPSETGSKIRDLTAVRNQIRRDGFISNATADEVFEKFGIPPIYSGKTKKKGNGYFL